MAAGEVRGYGFRVYNHKPFTTPIPAAQPTNQKVIFMAFNFFKKNFSIMLVIIFAILASLPLFHSGFYPMHDNEQIARLFDLNSAIVNGQFPPRIAPNLGYGYGYPFFNFYPSFAYYVGEAFHLLGAGFIVSTKLMLFTGFLLSAFFAYLLGRELFGKEGGIVTSAFYTFAPYHSVDIYVRGAYAEFFSFVFLPLIFWSLLKLSKTLKPYFAAVVSLGVCCLILSHNLIFVMFVPFIILWILFLYFKTERKKEFLIWSITGLILGFGASAFFSLPSYIERNFTLVRILTGELADYNLHFVCIHQLWNSTWGYGGSIPSCLDGLSFEVGKVQIAAAFLSLVLFSYAFFTKTLKDKFSVPFFLTLLAAAMFLTVRQSKPVWDLFSALSYVQFPWRFLTICVLFSSILAGALITFFKKSNFKIMAAFILVLVCIIFNISYFTPEKYLDVTDYNYTNIDTIRWDTSNLAYEYVPAKIATKKSKENTTQVDINHDQIKNIPYKIIKGIMIAKVIKDLPQEKIFNVYSITSGILRINTYSFPGWKVYVNGKNASFSDNNKLALIDVNIPFGKNTVSAVFTDTPIRKLGNLVSVASIISICWIGIASMKRKSNS